MANKKIPLPGTPVRGSKTGVPIMAALDLVGRRWALQIIWNLAEEAHGFRELRIICDGISPTILSTRLKELRVAKIIDYNSENKNKLTPLGKDLFLSIGSIKSWSENWARYLNES